MLLEGAVDVHSGSDQWIQHKEWTPNSRLYYQPVVIAEYIASVHAHMPLLATGRSSDSQILTNPHCCVDVVQSMCGCLFHALLLRLQSRQNRAHEELR